MDVLTEVLSTMRVSSALYARVEAAAPWGIDFEVHHAIKFCLVTRGSCCLVVPGKEPQTLAEGDFLLTTGGARYTLCDAPGSPSRPLTELLTGDPHGVDQAVRLGGPGETATLLNGILTFAASEESYFLGLLPPLLLIRREQAREAGFDVYLHRLTVEAQDPSPGAQLVANWLSGILFVHSVRVYARSEGARTGWLAALADRKLALALQAVHQRLAHRWTVQELAEVAGMSRSAFASAFKALVGKAPLEYVSDWRMQVAKGLLHEGSQKLSAVASVLGYESDTAFSKAFKRTTGATPAEYRRKGRELRAGSLGQ